MVSSVRMPRSVGVEGRAVRKRGEVRGDAVMAVLGVERVADEDAGDGLSRGRKWRRFGVVKAPQIQSWRNSCIPSSASDAPCWRTIKLTRKETK